MALVSIYKGGQVFGDVNMTCICLLLQIILVRLLEERTHTIGTPGVLAFFGLSRVAAKEAVSSGSW